MKKLLLMVCLTVISSAIANFGNLGVILADKITIKAVSHSVNRLMGSNDLYIKFKVINSSGKSANGLDVKLGVEDPITEVCKQFTAKTDMYGEFSYKTGSIKRSGSYRFVFIDNIYGNKDIIYYAIVTTTDIKQTEPEITVDIGQFKSGQYESYDRRLDVLSYKLCNSSANSTQSVSGDCTQWSKSDHNFFNDPIVQGVKEYIVKYCGKKTMTCTGVILGVGMLAICPLTGGAGCAAGAAILKLSLTTVAADVAKDVTKESIATLLKYTVSEKLKDCPYTKEYYLKMIDKYKFLISIDKLIPKGVENMESGDSWKGLIELFKTLKKSESELKGKIKNIDFITKTINDSIDSISELVVSITLDNETYTFRLFDTESMAMPTPEITNITTSSAKPISNKIEWNLPIPFVQLIPPDFIGIERSIEDSNNFKRIGDVGVCQKNEYTDVNIEPEKTYYYRLVSYNDILTSNPSKVVKIVSSKSGDKKTIPAPVITEYSLDKDGNPRIAWTWSNPNGDNKNVKFRIYRGTKSGEYSKTYGPYEQKFFSNTSVEQCTEYFYAVKAIKDDIESEYSNEANIVAQCKRKPSPPLNLKAGPYVEDGDEYVLLIWEKPKDPGYPANISYRLYKGTSRDDRDHFYKLTKYNKMNIKDVEECKSYYYWVTAVNEVGESADSNIAEYALDNGNCRGGSPNCKDVPSKPSIPKATLDCSSNSIKVDWSKPSVRQDCCDVTEYIIEDSDGHTKTVSETSKTYINLLNDKTYKYRIKAKNCNGYSDPSDWSDPVKFSCSSPNPANPVNFTAKLIQDKTKVELNWNKGSGDCASELYEIQKSMSGNVWETIYKTSSLFMKWGDTSSNQRYKFRIRAYCGDKFSDWVESNEVSTYPDPVPDSKFFDEMHIYYHKDRKENKISIGSGFTLDGLNIFGINFYSSKHQNFLIQIETRKDDPTSGDLMIINGDSTTPEVPGWFTTPMNANNIQVHPREDDLGKFTAGNYYMKVRFRKDKNDSPSSWYYVTAYGLIINANSSNPTFVIQNKQVTCDATIISFDPKTATKHTSNPITFTVKTNISVSSVLFTLYKPDGSIVNGLGGNFVKVNGNEWTKNIILNVSGQWRFIFTIICQNGMLTTTNRNIIVDTEAPDCKELPSKPGIPNVTLDCSNNWIKVEWIKPAFKQDCCDVSEYMVDISDSRVMTVSSNKAIIQNLVKDKSYKIRIKAKNCNGYGEWSDWSNQVTYSCQTKDQSGWDLTWPSDESTLLKSHVETQKLVLEWKKPFPEADSYVVEIYDDNVRGSLVFNHRFGDSSDTLRQESNCNSCSPKFRPEYGKRYVWRVGAKNSNSANPNTPTFSKLYTFYTPKDESKPPTAPNTPTAWADGKLIGLGGTIKPGTTITFKASTDDSRVKYLEIGYYTPSSTIQSLTSNATKLGNEFQVDWKAKEGEWSLSLRFTTADGISSPWTKLNGNCQSCDPDIIVSETKTNKTQNYICNVGALVNPGSGSTPVKVKNGSTIGLNFLPCQKGTSFKVMIEVLKGNPTSGSKIEQKNLISSFIGNPDGQGYRDYNGNGNSFAILIYYNSSGEGKYYARLQFKGDSTWYYIDENLKLNSNADPNKPSFTVVSGTFLSKVLRLLNMNISSMTYKQKLIEPSKPPALKTPKTSDNNLNFTTHGIASHYFRINQIIRAAWKTIACPKTTSNTIPKKSNVCIYDVVAISRKERT